MLTTKELIDYQREQVKKLERLTEEFETITGEEPAAHGMLPAFPDEYDKQEWDECQSAIWQIADTFTSELHEALDSRTVESQRIGLQQILKEVTDVDWEEV